VLQTSDAKYTCSATTSRAEYFKHVIALIKRLVIETSKMQYDFLFLNEFVLK